MTEPDVSHAPLAADDLRAVLNAQTACIPWEQLDPHWRRGALIRVAEALDLVSVAVAVVRDDRTRVEAWLQQGDLQQPDATTVADWHARAVHLWAVVTPPWVLVQERAA